MNTYQRQLLDKLITELTDKQSPNFRAAQMIAAELKGAMQSDTPPLYQPEHVDKPSEPTPDADGWVENSGVMPDCAITAVRLRCGEIRKTDNKRDVLWHFAGGKKQRMINHHKSYDVTHYRPA